jgi:hypothetical protein
LLDDQLGRAHRDRRKSRIGSNGLGREGDEKHLIVFDLSLGVAGVQLMKRLAA